MDPFGGELLLSWSEEYEGAGIGELDVVASSGRGFAGRGSAWVSASDLNQFATAAAAYPLDPENPPRLEGGIGAPGADDSRTLVSVAVRQVTRWGQLVIVASLADDATDEREGPYGIDQSATVVLPTTYQRLEDFVDELRVAVARRQGSATLGEETLR